LFCGFLLLGQAVVVQNLAHPLHERNPRLWAQVGIGELVYQIQELFALLIVQWFAVFAIIRLRRRCSDLQSLLHPLRGGRVVLGHRLVVDAGADRRGVFLPFTSALSPASTPALAL
jgi:hypothetical protein